MFRNKLSNHDILYGAEVDAVESKFYINNDPDRILNSKFVELKTSRCIKNTKQYKAFRR